MKYIVSISLLFCYSFLIFAQTGSGRIELKDIIDGSFSPSGFDEVQPMPDGEHYTMLSKDKKMILKYAYKNAQVTDTLFNVNTTRETTLEAIEGYMISSTGYRIVVWTDKEYIYRRSWKANLYDYDVRRNFLKPLSDTPGKVSNPTFSPDGRMCSFVRDNNIWLKKFDYDTESPVTKDGEYGKILNAITDWVYEEEFTVTNLMVWSPDSKFLSFVKFDESEVPTFSFQVFDGSLYPESLTFKYPKAGQNNSIVSCHTYSVETKDIKLMNIPIDENAYIPLIKYTENPDQLAVMTLNREQNVFNMYYVNPKSGVSRLILRDENKYYIESDLLKYITFTNENFVYLAEKDGYAHLYLYSITGIMQKQLTSGNWDVTAFYGVEPETQAIYYQSAEESPLRRAIYKVDGKGVKTKLSTKTGTNSAQFSSTLKYYINSFSNTTTPTFISINDNKGKEVKVLNDNSSLKSKLDGLRHPEKEFFTFNNDNGNEINGWMLKPLDFVSNKKYPVLVVQYSGPNSQQVLDKYNFGWEEYLASTGYLVVCIDSRGTGGRGEEFRKCTYMKLGILESDDLIAGAKYLGGLSYVDKDRIGIWGWSYGGYMTLMTMSRGNGIFKAGIAVAPVTDWKFYDSVYTERYMRTPKENFNGYKQSSPIELAKSLQGKLLLVHGTADDNVHYQNTLYYSDALVKAGKQFDMQIYTNKDHSMRDKVTRMHLYTRKTMFLLNNL